MLTLLFSCHSKSNDSLADTSINSDKRMPVDTPRSFLKNYGGNDNNRLFAFVGEKISVEPLPLKRYSMDGCFKATYAIVNRVYGDFIEDTIEFVAYDHYGAPPFSKFQNVLLYVSADSGTYYHQKYMYNDVYKTQDGRWAGTYAQDDYGHEYNRHTKIKPIKIDFMDRVAYSTKVMDDRGTQITFPYPEPYFKTLGDSAIAVYGNYVDDLFKLKRDGFLTARGIFKNGKLVQ